MLALNLPASLSPQASDGSVQLTGMPTDEPALIALFEQALGINVEPAAQLPREAISQHAVLATGMSSSPLSFAQSEGRSALVQQPMLLPGAVTTANLKGNVPVPVTAPVITAKATSAPIELDTVLPGIAVASAPLKPSAEGLAQSVVSPFVNKDAPLTSTLGETSLRTQTVSAENLRLPTDLPTLTKETLGQAVPNEINRPTRTVTAFPIDAVTMQSSVLNAEFVAAPQTVSEGSATHTAEPIRTVVTSNATLEPQAMAQVRDTIRAGTRTGTIEVQLDPPELGRVVIELEVGRHGQVKAIISASETDTLDLMRRNADTLAGDLKDSGFDDVELDWQQSDPPTDERIDRQALWPVVDKAEHPALSPINSRHDGILDIQL